MTDSVLDFDLTITRAGDAYTARVDSLARPATARFELPFAATELAAFMVAVGPPRATSRRLAPAASRVVDVRDYGARLGDRSRVELSAALDPSQAYRAVITSLPVPTLRVAVVGRDAESVALREALGGASALVGPCAGVSDADLVVSSTGAGFALTRPGATRPLGPVVVGAERVTRTLAALDHVARWLRLVDLQNPSTALGPDAVRVRLETPDGRHAGDDGFLQVAYAGATAPPFTVSLTNTTGQTLWCALLDLTDAYGVFTDALPAGSVALGPGEAVSVDLVGQVPDRAWTDGVEAATDHLKVVVSTLEFDPRGLQQDDLSTGAPSPAPATRGLTPPRTTLERLLTRVVTRRLGPTAPDAAVADWRTDDFWVTTSRPRNT